jgi:hypothetical protein
VRGELSLRNGPLEISLRGPVAFCHADQAACCFERVSPAATGGKSATGLWENNPFLDKGARSLAWVGAQRMHLLCAG